MIHSAQVFSPRPSQDPRENLRILRSPLKNTFKSSALASPSMPLRTSIFPISSQSPYTTPPKHEPVFQNDEEEDHIILVDGNHPRVVEEDKDLVILEDVEMPRVGTPTFTPIQPQPQSQVQFQTPVRQRSLSRNTLHRAVLIRSAQRAVMKAESAEREREEEEMEVLGAVVADIGSESESGEDVVMHDMPNEQDVVEGGNEDESESDGEEEHEEDRERGRTGQTSKESQKSVWRKSLERIWPFRSSSPDPKEENDEEDDQNVRYSRFWLLHLSDDSLSRPTPTLETTPSQPTTHPKKTTMMKMRTRICPLLFLRVPSPTPLFPCKPQSAEP